LFHTPTTESSSTVISPGTISGSAILKKILVSPAPSIRAASISSRGTDSRM
jgi:hypothetical protein